MLNATEVAFHFKVQQKKNEQERVEERPMRAVCVSLIEVKRRLVGAAGGGSAGPPWLCLRAAHRLWGREREREREREKERENTHTCTHHTSL